MTHDDEPASRATVRWDLTPELARLVRDAIRTFAWHLSEPTHARAMLKASQDLDALLDELARGDG